jgi:hypothetical protein
MRRVFTPPPVAYPLLRLRFPHADSLEATGDRSTERLRGEATREYDVITIGLLGCLVIAALVAGIVLAAKRGVLEVTFGRLAWLPVTALLTEFTLARPMLSRLSYFAIVPPLLTCLFSLFLAVAGATLVAVARERNEPSSGLIRATVVAAIPGMLLFVYMLYSFVVASTSR